VRHLTLTEYATTPGVRLTMAERDALQRAVPELAIAPSRGLPGRFDLTPGSWVGAADVGPLTVEIRPKLPTEQVIFLLSYALDPRGWRDEPHAFDDEPSLVEAVAAVFAAHVRRALRGGVLHGYRGEEAALPVVRGRIRFTEQVRSHYGVFPPVEVAYDDLTEDVTENRLVKVALVRLSRLRLRSPTVRRGLRRLEPAFGRVSLTEYAGTWPEIVYTALNERYRPAVELAKRILSGSSFAFGRGGVPARSFLVDMNRVFEDFVAVALRETLGVSEHAFPQGLALGGSRVGMRRTLALDEAGVVGLVPDLSWWDGGRCTFAGDVKYKRVAAAGIEHPDLYQLLAYVTAAELPGGLLIYAAGEGEPVSHTVVHAGKELHVVALDLSGSAADVLAQVATIAQRVRSLHRQARTGSAA
jgi:5-methylcytosine-specific restriction enzyme subunit McrC